MDKGESWQRAERTNHWSFSFSPEEYHRYDIGVRCLAGNVPSPMYRQKTFRVRYENKRTKEVIAKQLRKLERSYRIKSRFQIMALISRNVVTTMYPNFRALEEEIKNDIQWGQDILYRFYIDQVLRNKSIHMVRTHWYLTYWGLERPEEGETEFYFDFGDRVKIANIRGEKPFGLIERAYPDLMVDASEHQYVGQGFGGNILVLVHNIGKITAKKVKIKVTYTFLGTAAGGASYVEEKRSFLGDYPCSRSSRRPPS